MSGSKWRYGIGLGCLLVAGFCLMMVHDNLQRLPLPIGWLTLLSVVAGGLLAIALACFWPRHQV